MLDASSILERLGRLPDHPPSTPQPLEQLARRGRRIRRRRRTTVTLLGAVAVVGIGGATLLAGSGAGPSGRVQTGAESNPGAEAQTAVDYLDDVLTVLENNAYFATPEMIGRWRTEATTVAAGASGPADTHPFVRRIIAELDSASPSSHGQSLWSPERVAAYEARLPVEPPGLVSTIEGGTGYLELTPIDSMPETEEGIDYIDNVRAALAGSACGWILDLRAPYPDATSNLETMLTAVGPLLPTGQVASIRTAHAADMSLVLSADGSLSRIPASDTGASASDGPPQLALPVAILQGPGTTTTYETVLLAFRGRADTRSFGEPSAGQSVLNEAFPLDDGSLLWLTTGHIADRNGQTFDGPIAPTVMTATAPPGDRDPAHTAAQAWLDRHPSCQ